MCKLMIGVNSNNGEENLEKITRIQLSSLRTEDDGAAGFVLTKSGEVKTFRSLKNYPQVFRGVLDEIPNARLISIHTRTGTTGSKTEENVHMWNAGNRFFAHNGFVSNFHKNFSWNNQTGYHGRHGEGEKSDTHMTTAQIEATIASCQGCFTSHKGYCKRHKDIWEMVEWEEGTAADGTPQIILPRDREAESDNDMTDSQQFLLSLPAGAGVEEIREHVKETGLTGFAFLYDANQGKAFMIVRKKSYVLTDKKSFAAFFSYSPETEVTTEKTADVLGVRYKVGEEKVKIPQKERELVEGVYEIALPVS